MFNKRFRRHRARKPGQEFQAEVEVYQPSGEESILKGIPSSPGIAFGKAVVIKPESMIVSTETIPKEKIPAEIKRLENALGIVIEEFYYVLNKVKKEARDVFAVIETNLLIVKDKFFIDSIKNRIHNGYPAESAIVQEFESQKKLIKNSNDSILLERVMEFDHIQKKLLSALNDRNYYYKISRNSIVVAQSVTPSDLVNFKESGVTAIITEVGGISAHSSILARSFEIPEVIGLKDVTSLIETNSEIIVDGYSGDVIVFPSRQTTDEYLDRKAKESEHKEKLGKLVKMPSETRDGRKINLYANIDLPNDIDSAIMVGAEGIGLVRTEYLAMTMNEIPGEDRQYEVYNEIAERAYPCPVTFRVFDIGSDKYTDGGKVEEANPALGFRGIRFLLHNKDLFKAQIRAILKASRNKNIRLMLPMISGINELLLTHDLINECKETLANNNILFDNDLPVGVMIETPAAALLADGLAAYSDFFSIGTNDLTQYTLAADRTNEMVSQYFDPFHPAVIRLIKMTVEAAKKRNIPVGVCGELAGHAGATTLLVGLGIDELSVSPAILLELKNRVLETNYADAAEVADKALQCSTYDEVRELLSISH